jgi:hypothetical protein
VATSWEDHVHARHLSRCESGAQALYPWWRMYSFRAFGRGHSCQMAWWMSDRGRFRLGRKGNEQLVCLPPDGEQVLREAYQRIIKRFQSKEQ